MCNIYQLTAISIFLLVFGIHKGTGVKIKKLQVPKVIQHGAPVVLDCDFTLEDYDDIDDKDVGLVVKWYFNENDNKPVYQWIPGSSKRPQELGVLKGRLNLEYAASGDANSVHRALHILKPSPDLSGDYTCHVATFQSEDRKTKSMLVFVPEKNLMLKKVAVGDEGFIRVLCTADGVFPRPTMALRSQEREIAEADVVVRERGQLFDISASTTLPALKDPEEFSCELRIPQANYTVRRETVFYPGDSANAITMCRWLSLAPWMILLWTNFIRRLVVFCAVILTVRYCTEASQPIAARPQRDSQGDIRFVPGDCPDRYPVPCTCRDPEYPTFYCKIEPKPEYISKITVCANKHLEVIMASCPEVEDPSLSQP